VYQASRAGAGAAAFRDNAGKPISITVESMSASTVCTVPSCSMNVIFGMKGYATPSFFAGWSGYSGDGGQAFHLKADSDSGRSRTAFR
jgi:hypothetical protein